MNLDHFLEEREQAWITLGSLVTEAMIQHGAALFPQDNGQRYRYRFMTFPHAYFDAVTMLLNDTPYGKYDKWVLRNERLILELDALHWVRLIGLGHLYSESLYIHRNYSPADRRGLAWVQRLLCGIYDFNDTVAEQWTDITANACDIRDLIREANLMYYKQIADLLLLDVRDTENRACWNGVFFTANLSCCDPEDPEWIAACDPLFLHCAQIASQ
jgi:hypothetical protein